MDLSKACASVLIAQKDTPSIRVCIIRFTALPPPPPTPRTLIIQGDPRPFSGRITPSSSSDGSMDGISECNVVLVGVDRLNVVEVVDENGDDDDVVRPRHVIICLLLLLLLHTLLLLLLVL